MKSIKLGDNVLFSIVIFILGIILFQAHGQDVEKIYVEKKMIQHSVTTQVMYE